MDSQIAKWVLMVTVVWAAEVASGQAPPRQEAPFGHSLDLAPVSVAVSATTDESAPSEGASSSPNGEDSLEERIQKLEEAWDEQRTESEAAAEKAALAPTFEIGGRIHMDYWSFLEDSEGIHWFENPGTGVDPEDRFTYRRVRLEIQGDILETMIYRMQIEFSEPQNPEMRDVYIGWDELPHNQTLIVGNHKRPLGLDHWNSSRFNVFMERPTIIESFNEDARRIGASVWGHTDDDSLFWQYGTFNLQNTQAVGESIGDSYQFSANARLGGSPWYDESSDGRGYYHWAVAGMLARPDGDVDPRDTNENEARFRTRPEARSTNRWIDTGRIPGAEWYEIVALESMLNIGPWHFVAEYQHNWLQRDGSTVGTGPDVQFHGGYVQAAYFLTGEHMPYDRQLGQLDRIRPFENFFLVERCTGGLGTGWGAWQVKARYSYADLTSADIAGGVENNVTVGFNWWWNAYARMQFDAVYGEIDQHRPVNGHTSGDFWIMGTRFAVDF